MKKCFPDIFYYRNSFCSNFAKNSLALDLCPSPKLPSQFLPEIFIH